MMDPLPKDLAVLLRSALTAPAYACDMLLLLAEAADEIAPAEPHAGWEALAALARALAPVMATAPKAIPHPWSWSHEEANRHG